MSIVRKKKGNEKGNKKTTHAFTCTYIKHLFYAWKKCRNRENIRNLKVLTYKHSIIFPNNSINKASIKFN